MHYRFRGNPGTNDAARLSQFNEARARKGLPPMSLAEFAPIAADPRARVAELRAQAEAEKRARLEAEARKQHTIF